MNATWSNEQRRCLAALGYSVFRPASDEAGKQQTTATAGDRGADVSPRSTKAHITAVAIDPILRALIRAAGQDPSRIDNDEWKRTQRIPSLVQLRNNPAAKRALWPQLRALRGERGPS